VQILIGNDYFDYVYYAAQPYLAKFAGVAFANRPGVSIYSSGMVAGSTGPLGNVGYRLRYVASGIMAIQDNVAFRIDHRSPLLSICGSGIHNQ
jgi:hypothetical protein